MGSADIVVLGGGPAGYAVALRAAAHGLAVTVVEADAVGGTCLHRGCIPSKALLHVGAVLDTVREADRLGLQLSAGPLDVARVGSFRDGIVRGLHRGLESLLDRRRVQVVAGHGRLADDGRTVLVGDERVPGRAVVVATGSRVRPLPGVDVDGQVVLTSDEAVRLTRVPRRALVIGSGAVGLEFASLYRSLGAEEVTLVEALARIAPLEDEAVSGQLTRALGRRGITMLAPAQVESVKVEDDLATAVVRHDDEERRLVVDTVLVAVGRLPRTEGIGLEAVGVLDERGYARVDEWCRTPAEGVFAVGDVLAPPSLALAHAGFAEGFLVADQVAGQDRLAPVDYAQVPRVTYTSPEVASVGLTEAQARERFGDVAVATYSMRGNAKGLITGSDGFVKVVSGGPEGAVLGVHVVGPHATDLIAEAQLITAWEALPEEVARLVHPHPTLAETLGEAHLAAAGVPFHTH